MKQKPEKIIYDNQKLILNKIVDFIRTILNENVKEAYLFGSVVNGKFGKYAENYKSHEGSDIDLIVFIKNRKVPNNWK